MSIDALSSPWLQAADWLMPVFTTATTPIDSTPADSTLASTVPATPTAGTTTPSAPPPTTEDPGLQALVRDWILQALTAEPAFTEPAPSLSSALPTGGGLGLESLATAYDYDSFAGDDGTTPSYLLANGDVVDSKQLDLLV